MMLLSRLARRSAVLSALLAAGGALAWVGPPTLSAARTADAQLAAVAALTAWFVLGWLLIASLSTACSALPGIAGSASGLVAGRIAPAVLRRVIDAALGLAVAASVAVPSAAVAAPAPAPPRPAQSSAAAATQGIEGDLGDRVFAVIAVPPDAPPPGFDRPAQSPHSQRPRDVPKQPTPLAVVHGVQRPERGAGEVVVRRGDSLWSIAAAELGREASSAEIDSHWRRWYAANRAAIGADPDLILPGTRLVRPAPAAD